MKPVVTLIRTSPPTSKGSMAAFGRMVESALTPSSDFTVQTCDLLPCRARSMWHEHIWRIGHAKHVLNTHPADLYHLLDGSMAAFVPRAFRARTVVTVHDMIPLLQIKNELPGRPSFPARWLIRRNLAALCGMAGITTDSANSLQDLRRLTGTPLEGPVIPLAVRAFSDETVALRREMAPSRYILHVGNNAQYKNRQGVLDVYARLQDLDDVELVMVGPAPTDALRRKARSLSGRVRFLINVADAELGGLYRRASLMLFPSLYEGFGMPVLEAMAAGCPVVCTDGGSLPEVAGDAALIAQVGDIKGLAGHCQAVLTEAELREKLVNQGREHAASFTMQRFSDSLMAWYGKILKLEG